MRQWLGPGLVFLGTALVVFGALVWLWVIPTVRQAPIDQQSRTVSVGTGSYFDLAAGERVTSDAIRSVINTESDQSVYEGDDPIDDDIAVYDQTSGLFDDETGYEITYSDSRIALDRVSALPVECCGADEIDGLTVKWPFGVEQADYDLWDSSLGAATTAVFTGPDEIDGLEVYHFVADVPVTDAGPVTADAEFPRIAYEASKEYLVEPVTGRIISSRQDVTQSVVGEDGEVLFDAADVSLEVSNATVAENVALAKDQTGQLGLLDTLAWLGPLLGLLAIAAGVVVTLIDRGTRRYHEAEDPLAVY